LAVEHGACDSAVEDRVLVVGVPGAGLLLFLGLLGGLGFDGERVLRLSPRVLLPVLTLSAPLPSHGSLGPVRRLLLLVLVAAV